MEYSCFDGTMMNMTYPEVEKAIKNESLVFLPIGTVEAHGPHLPLGTDTYGAMELAKICKSLLKRRGVESVIAPPFILGISNILADFPGTFRFRNTTFIECLKDFCTSLKSHGFKLQVILNHHLEKDHVISLFEAMEMINKEFDVSLYFLGDKDIIDRLPPGTNQDRLIISSWTTRESGLLGNYNDFHAGEKETSFGLAYLRKLVRPGWEKLGPCLPELSDWRAGGAITRKATPNAYYGDPSRASADKGEIIYKKIAEGYVEALMLKFFKEII